MTQYRADLQPPADDAPIPFAVVARKAVARVLVVMIGIASLALVAYVILSTIQDVLPRFF